MGRRGPVPLPDNVKDIRGRTGHNTKVEQAVKAPPGRPTPPTWLNTEAKAEWRRVVPELDRLGVLSKIDRAILSAYCDAWSKMLEAQKALKLNPRARAGATGLILKDRDGNQRKHPAWQIYREATTLVAQLAKELYLTPVARLRVTKPEDADGQEEDGVID